MSYACVEFYRRNARRYADVTESRLQSVALDSTHPRLKGDWDLLERLMQLAPGPTGLDAGCGAGARDVRRLLARGCDVTGIDGVEEVVRLTRDAYPAIERRILAADLRDALPFEGEGFDFALCVSVLQHIEARTINDVTLPELVRVLRPGGILLLAFKKGSGAVSVYDAHYGEDREFLLHDEKEILERLTSCGMDLVHAHSPEELGDLMYCTDVKGLRYCAFFARKRATAGPDMCVPSRTRT